ncbi:MAG: hypothetical protein BMS9Abin26_0222 [Gammaproteobacteria bacterium]|nr:MAG: hypothetical protein BMS9Abin26_0222 [Gammaproteobacteria bacterium]
MNTRWLLNLVLLILVSVLVLLAVYEPGKKVPIVRPITPLIISDIDRISIKRGDSDIQFRKQATHWIITSPVKTVASQLRINGLLGLAGAHSFASFEVAPEDLKKYAIGKGQITFNDTSISFGDVEEVNKRRYVYVNNKVHLIVDSYYHQLITDSTSFVSSRLLPPDSKIASLGLKPVKQPYLKLQRTADDRWRVLPDSVLASAEQLNQLINTWQTSTALYVSKASAAPSAGTIDISLVSGETLAFQIIKTEADEFILRRPDIKVDYHMLAETRKQLLQLPALENDPAQGSTDSSRDAANK